MNKIARIKINIEAEDYNCVEEYFVLKTENFDNDIKALKEFINENAEDPDMIFDYIKENFTIVELENDYNFDL